MALVNDLRIQMNKWVVEGRPVHFNLDVADFVGKVNVLRGLYKPIVKEVERFICEVKGKDSIRILGLCLIDSLIQTLLFDPKRCTAFRDIFKPKLEKMFQVLFKHTPHRQKILTVLENWKLEEVYDPDFISGLIRLCPLDPPVIVIPANELPGIGNPVIGEVNDEEIVDGEDTDNEMIPDQSQNFQYQHALTGGEKTIPVGIDLGTSNSCVSVFKHGNPKVIQNSTPSYVRVLKNGNVKVGEDARSCSSIYAESTLYDSKRLLGMKYSDPYVQSNLHNWSFELIDANPMAKYKDKEGRSYSPVCISRVILEYLRDLATENLSGVVTDAVLTVPATFSQEQRFLMKSIAESINLNVLGMISEPTAAAISYIFEAKVEDFECPRNVLVFDMGGGTCDTSVLRISTNKIEVLSVEGNSRCGGVNIDDILVQHVLKKFEAANRISLEDKGELATIRIACEDAKIRLTERPTHTICILKLHREYNLELPLTREEFNIMCNPVFEDALNTAIDAVRSAHLNNSDINVIIPVGGSSKIENIKMKLRKQFNNANLFPIKDSCTCVAQGAAIAARIYKELDENEGDTWFHPTLLNLADQVRNIDTILPKSISFVGTNNNTTYRLEKNSSTKQDIPLNDRELVVTKFANQETYKNKMKAYNCVQDDEDGPVCIY